MRNLDNLFSNSKYPLLRAPSSISDGGHHYRNDSSNPPEILAARKRIDVYVDDCDDFFYVAVSETVVLPERHSAGKKPRRRQLTRTAWAWVAPIDYYFTLDYTLKDAVCDAAAKLRENWARRYQAELNAVPLEDLITLAVLP